MLNFAVNVSTLWRDIPFLDRFQKVRDAGFDAVEFWWHGDQNLDEVVQAIKAQNLKVVLHNMNSGNMPAGERGFANDPARTAEWREAFRTAVDFSRRVGCTRINCLSGRDIGSIAREAQLDTVYENYQWALPIAQQHDIAMYVEPLNSYDTPNYLWPTTTEGVAFMRRVNSPAVRLQYDTYHMGRMEGLDVASAIRKHLRDIGHIQIADVPDRHEPGTGQLDWRAIFQTIEDAGYDGYIGLEYIAATTPEASFAWLPDGKRTRATTSELKV